MDSIPLNSSCSTQHVVALSSGEAELHATGRAAAGGLQSVQLLAVGGMELKLEVLTDSMVNIGVLNRIGLGRVRHLDVKWLWTQEAVQGGRVSLKKVGTCSNVSDLTTKHHDEERLKVLMTLGRLRYTRGHKDAVSAASEGRTAAVNVVLLRLWCWISSLGDAGGSERRELGGGRLTKKSQDQHTSNALVELGSSDPSIRNAEEHRVVVWKSERMLQQRLDRGYERYLWSTTRKGCKMCTDTDWACEKKPLSGHDNVWTDLV